ncbi:hypothetical protein EYF80_031881 [Liparis tanakae]|uniref:Uncharacterized protein n=1 Tax=Liparis tanakae TaxID=230148 RepID=A0A4Z2GYZ7_9TELE|nr:hypothetical protein EYF80_031881 [Liparis tanakae]
MKSQDYLAKDKGGMGCSCHVEDRRDDPRRDAFLHMQTPVSTETPSPCPGSSAERGDPDPDARGLRRPVRRHSRSPPPPPPPPPPPFRSCSIPIIPSVQCQHGNEASCMQTEACGTAAACCEAARREKAGHAAAGHAAAAPFASSSSFCSAAAVGQRRQDEAAHRKQEDGGGAGSGGSTAAPAEARDTVCFLNLNGGSAGALSRARPTQTQLLSPSLLHRDLGLSSQ